VQLFGEIPTAATSAIIDSERPTKPGRDFLSDRMQTSVLDHRPVHAKVRNEIWRLGFDDDRLALLRWKGGRNRKLAVKILSSARQIKNARAMREKNHVVEPDAESASLRDAWSGLNRTKSCRAAIAGEKK